MKFGSGELNVTPRQDGLASIPKAYLDRAIARRREQQLADGMWFTEIPGFAGVWAQGKTPGEARAELYGVLTGWLSLKLNDNDTDIPIVDGIDLNGM